MPAAGSSLECLFSYGTLQLESVQLATFGRRIAGTADALSGFEQSVVELEDGTAVAPLGRAQFPIIRFSGRDSDIVRGVVFRVTEDELQRADEYETAAYRRIPVTLRSGARAWVYVDPALPAPGVDRGVDTVNAQVQAVGFVEALRRRAEDDYWGGEQACISLAREFTPDALQGLADFSHIEVLFLFHQVDPSKIVSGARHPRNNKAWPAVGIFAQRGKNRPNRIGSTICRLLRVETRKLFVAELDAIDGTPVLDIKPVMTEFLPRESVRQPDWSHEIMREYWLRKA
jgi:tRNA-Thr(GGU) m(6)t(6)A37 methyltransferase TsaA